MKYRAKPQSTGIALRWRGKKDGKALGVHFSMAIKKYIRRTLFRL